MQHLIFAEYRARHEVMLFRRVRRRDASYLRKVVLPAMRPLTDQEYINGPLAILSMGAHFSYVLHENDALWCIEWDPGLLVIRFSPDRKIHWSALRSPNPTFGGRVASPQEIEAYDEDAYDPQYNIVFDAWDAQFDEDEREDWSPANDAMRRKWELAMAHAQQLGEWVNGLEGNEAAYEEWMNRCMNSPICSGRDAIP